MITKELIDILYISGYIDGDGCFSIDKNCRKRHCKIIITSTNRHVLYDFAVSFGGNVMISKKGSLPHRKPCHQYQIGGTESENLSTKMRQFLVEKKGEATAFCNFFHTSATNERIKLLKELARLKEQDSLVVKEDMEKLKSLSKHIQPSEQDFVYLAGFVDAECNLGIQHYKPKNKPNQVFKIVLQCNNSKSPIFYWLKQRFGGSAHWVERRSKTPNHRNQILWKISGKPLYEILKRIHPYLRYKKPVCERLMEFYETTLTNGGARHTEVFRNKYQSVLALREEIVRQVHDLNHKGV